MDLNQRASGVLLHITSLPGPNGIGDMGPDAYRFVDWLESSGQSLWQLLPMTPIGPGNSPYQSVSAFAGSPLMVAFEPLLQAGWLGRLGEPEGGWDPHRVDFGKVINWRMSLLRDAFSGFESRAGEDDTKAFERWMKKEASWLNDYALFMALETAHGGMPWWTWEVDLQQRKKTALTAAKKKHADEVRFWAWVQWCFDQQLTSLKTYANDKGIQLVGDLPIFIAHHSADCWARPDLYELDDSFQPTVVAGVPPDDLGPEGQRWGNPLYRWDRMAAEGYDWWVARTKRALAQADVFRIDHFRGFAGYWEIPSSSPSAKQGQWLPGPGKALFDAIAKALGPLPIIAEDLGLITPDVHELRDGCGFPGMKILQFAFGADGNHEFLPQSYRRDTVVYTGTHDNDTVLGWWANATPREKHFAGTYLACGSSDVHWAMIRSASNSVSNLAIFPMQDILGLGSEHRMNIPGTLGDHNWSWRMTWDMLNADHGRVLGMVSAASGRAPVKYLGA
jgi:4-alpha-glucanotransferase